MNTLLLENVAVIDSTGREAQQTEIHVCSLQIRVSFSGLAMMRIA